MGPVPVSSVNEPRSTVTQQHHWGPSMYLMQDSITYILILLACYQHHRATPISSPALIGSLAGQKPFQLQTSLLIQSLKPLSKDGYHASECLLPLPRTKVSSLSHHYGHILCASWVLTGYVPQHVTPFPMDWLSISTDS